MSRTKRFERPTRRPVFRAATLLLTAMIMATPYVTAAQGGSVHVQLTAADLLIPAATPVSGQALMLGAPVDGGAGDREERLQIRADRVQVALEVHHKQGILGTALVPSDVEPEIRRWHYDDAAGSSRPTGRLDWLLMAPPESVDRLQVEGYIIDAKTVTPRPDATFRSHGGSTDPLDGALGAAVSVHTMDIKAANLHVAMADDAMVWTIRGDIQITLYDHAIELHHATGSVTHETGLVAVEHETNVPGAVQRYEDRLAVIDLEGAVLTYATAGAPTTLALESMEATPVGTLEFRYATGQIGVQGAVTDVDAAHVVMDMQQGTLRLRPTDGTLRLAAEVDGQGTVTANGQAIGPAIVAADSQIDLSLVSVASVLVAFALLVSWAWRRRTRLRRHPDIFLYQVKQEYQRGRFRRAAAIAARLARIDPRNEEAIMLGAMAFLKTGRAHALLRLLKQLLTKTPDESGLMHLMLSLGRLQLGDSAGSQDALREALDLNPGLEPELLGTELARFFAELSAADPWSGDTVSYA